MGRHEDKALVLWVDRRQIRNWPLPDSPALLLLL